jgi:hypothetical protein
VIWGEDIDFTARIAAERPGYMVGTSVAVHHTASRGHLRIFDETDPERVRNFFYHYRNGVYLRRRHYGLLQMVLFIGKSVLEAARCLRLRDQPLRRTWSIAYGLVAGLAFHPVHQPLTAPNAPMPRGGTAPDDHAVAQTLLPAAGAPHYELVLLLAAAALALHRWIGTAVVSAVVAGGVAVARTLARRFRASVLRSDIEAPH